MQNTELKPEVVEYRVGAEAHYNVATYDARRYVGPQKEYQQLVTSNAYKKLIGSLKGKRILDIGCGTGRGVVEFSQESSLAVGGDASLDMLSFTKRKCAKGISCALVATYAQNLPFKDRSFDVVCSLNFLHLFNVETQRAMVEEMKRVLKPGGILVLEFKNALNGIARGLYLRWFGDHPGSLPGEVKYVLGKDCRVQRVYGAPFPTLWRYAYRHPSIFVPIEKVGQVFPFKWVCQELFYKVSKEA